MKQIRLQFRNPLDTNTNTNIYTKPKKSTLKRLGTHTPPPVQVWGASHEYSATGFRQRRTHSLGSRRINMHIHTPYCGGGKYTNNKTIIFVMKKHCQRHSGPEGWGLHTKITYFRFNFITFTKHQQQNTDQTPASNLAWTSTSKSWPNLVLKVWTKV